MGLLGYILNLGEEAIIDRGYIAEVEVSHTVHYGTGTHGDETLAARGGEVPAQMRWSEIHPAGKRILPKGSPQTTHPLTEINWEDTLGGRFALALERLEGLLYAIYGSRPAAYSNGGGGWNKCQWYDRLNPRCLWGPEAWKPKIIVGPVGCGPEGNCWDYQVFEYAALGTSPYGWPAPSVPIRPRSEDPAAQFASRPHDSTIFPIGSVTREHSAYPYSPEGSGWFGATQPGRAGGEAWLTTGNGYTQKTGQSVKVQWTKPSGVHAPTVLQLKYSTRAPGGSWSGWTNVNMTLVSGAYEGTIPLQAHGTECRWYIRYFYDDTSPANADIERFEPGDRTEPLVSNAYTFTWFYHFNPFANGLPEMLSSLDGVDTRHGTDHYEFDGSETIQPELINLARWAISAVCGTTCHYSDVGCKDGDNHPGRLYHSPRLRSDDHGTCCVPFPIRFYWSGSNQHPHYVRGGKGAGGAPLSNALGTVNAGSESARKTWRGLDNLYRGEPMGNPYYGQGASWGVPPFELELWYEPGIEDEAQIFAKFNRVGLRAGDVIDAVHIEEIIGAVDYLVGYGAWTTSQVKSCKKAIDGFVGRPCGYVKRSRTRGPQVGDPVNGGMICAGNGSQSEGVYYSTLEFTSICSKCCGPGSDCPYQSSGPYTYTYDTIIDDVIVGQTESGTIEDGPMVCNPMPTPTWAECWAQESPCVTGKCTASAFKSVSCGNGGGGGATGHPKRFCVNKETVEAVTCDGLSPYAPSVGVPEIPDGCGIWKCEADCWLYNAVADTIYACNGFGAFGVEGSACGGTGLVATAGFAAYICTPPACQPGWDDDHGSDVLKKRLGHTWSGGLASIAVGPGGHESGGNCYGDIFLCGTLEAGDHPNVWFQERRAVVFNGFASSWYAEGPCDCSPVSAGGCPVSGALHIPAPLPGTGNYAIDGTPLCSQRVHGFDEFDTPVTYDKTECSCTLGDFEVCKGNATWVAIDLNLDGSGRPYRGYAGRDGTDAAHGGRCVPWLRPYDLSKDPATWMHGCPCETWTGAGTC